MRMPVRAVLCGLSFACASGALIAVGEAPLRAPAQAPIAAAVAPAAAAAAAATAPAPAAAAAPAATAAPTAAAPAAAPPVYAPLDVPDWAVKESESASKDRPWILIVDDPQCPYCMQLSLGIEKARE